MEARAKTLPIKFMAGPTQLRFIRSRAEADFFCSRMREGKTAGLVWACWHHCNQNPEANWIIIRDTWVNLQRTTLEEFKKWFPFGVAGTWHAAEKRFQWKLGEMRGSIYWMGLDDANDVGNLQSMTIGGFGIDEVAPALGEDGTDSGGVDELVFDMANTRLSQPGMGWYAAKLAANNPDEDHWTYRRFVEPGEPGFRFHQPIDFENEKHLDPGFYKRLEKRLQHRPELLRRFHGGKFGFTQRGKAVTPEWDDAIHVVGALEPDPDVPLTVLWDGWHHPSCVITQKTKNEHGGTEWRILESHIGEGVGVKELIGDVIKPRLQERFRGFELVHVGDPSMETGDQSSVMNSAVMVIRKMLGGPWHAGPSEPGPRIEPLRAALRQNGLVKVDRRYAKEVQLALRGGWHRHVNRSGVVGHIVKDHHSHPGDAVSYGAAYFFPLGKVAGIQKKGRLVVASAQAFARRDQKPRVDTRKVTSLFSRPDRLGAA